VLATTLEQTRAARLAGMRVISCHDNDLADAVLFGPDIDFGLDDIATPGSFWLNPPHPRDDEGNRVDPYALAEQMIHAQGDSESENDAAQQEEMDDDEFDEILADLAPL
jgi:hypothetical protein